MKRIFTSIKFVVLAALCLFVGEVSAQTNLLTNGGFEDWTDTKPTHWITTSTAGNATLAQATDARTGSYSVQVNGASSNKRLGYEEMTLKAGTYTFSFWVKAATEEGASVRPGYVPVTDGKAGNYVYGNYTNGVTNAEWVNVTYEFTLAEAAEVALVIMNSKNPGKNVLVDDASLTTTDGGIEENENPDTPEEPEVETVGEGTKENPYTVADVIALNNPGTTSWVKGYIVGFVKGSPISENAVFGTEGAKAANLLLAPSADTKDHAQCIPVALPTGAVRDALNLLDNPGALGVEVSICGQLVAYYTVNGLKEPSEYVLHGTIVPGEPTDPEQPEEPTDSLAEGGINNPYTVTRALEVINSGAATTEKVYVKGVITGIDEVSTSYGNATYHISAGDETGTSLMVFRGYYLDGEKFTAEDQIKVGDEVLLHGVLKLYSGTPEITNSSIITLTAGTEPGEPTDPEQPEEPTDSLAIGTINNPYTVELALEAIDEGLYTEDMVYVKGKISQIDDISTQYGNATYYISTDGTTTNHLTVFRGKFLNGEKFTATNQIKVGDEVVVYGVLTLYGGTTPEITNSQLASLVSTGEPAEPELPTDLVGAGTEENPYTVADANRIVESGATLLDMVYLKGNITNIKSVDTGSYGNAEYFISDGDSTTATIKVYRGYYFNGDKFTAADQIKVGDAVVLLGKISQYNGEPQIAQGSKIITLNGATGGDNTGGEDDDDTPVMGEGVAIEGAVVTLTNNELTAGADSIAVDFNAYGWENATKLVDSLATVTLADGTMITFNGNGEQNVPTFYTATKGIRIYKNTGFTISSTKAIAKVVMTCDGEKYVGNATATIEAQGNDLIYTNVFTEPSGGGVQLRVKTLVIFYAADGETAIEDVEAATATGAIEVYTLGGVKVGDSLKGLKKGMYILKQGGKSRVIVL